MRAPKPLLRLGISVALVAALIPATLQARGSGSLGRSLAELGTDDKTAMERARSEVLEKMTPGATSAWKNETTGHIGEAHLLRAYQKDGMACGEVEQILKTPEVSRYVIPFCRVSDGTWRTAF